MSLPKKFSHCLSKINQNSFYAILGKTRMLYLQLLFSYFVTDLYFVIFYFYWIDSLTKKLFQVIIWISMKARLIISSKKSDIYYENEISELDY